MQRRQAVQVDAQGEPGRHRQPGQGLFQEYTVATEINMLVPVHQLFHQLKDGGVDQRLPPGEGDHRRAALGDRVQAFLQSQGLAQGVPILLDAAATRAGEVALMRGLQHQHQGKALFPLPALLQEVAGQIQAETQGESQIEPLKKIMPNIIAIYSRFLHYITFVNKGPFSIFDKNRSISE